MSSVHFVLFTLFTNRTRFQGVAAAPPHDDYLNDEDYNSMSEIEYNRPAGFSPFDSRAASQVSMTLP